MMPFNQDHSTPEDPTKSTSQKQMQVDLQPSPTIPLNLAENQCGICLNQITTEVIVKHMSCGQEFCLNCVKLRVVPNALWNCPECEEKMREELLPFNQDHSTAEDPTKSTSQKQMQEDLQQNQPSPTIPPNLAENQCGICLNQITTQVIVKHMSCGQEFCLNCVKLRVVHKALWNCPQCEENMREEFDNEYEEEASDTE